MPKSEGTSGVALLGTPLVAQTASGHHKWVPRAPKVLPMIKKYTKNNTKEPPRLRKRAPIVNPTQEHVKSETYATTFRGSVIQ